MQGVWGAARPPSGEREGPSPLAILSKRRASIAGNRGAETARSSEQAARLEQTHSMITLNDLLAAGGHLQGAPRGDTFADISYDSRLTRPGELFLALRTPHADGHDFIPAALAAGATGVVCTWPPESADATIILADDPAALIQRWAARRLAAVAPLVVGVTGSVGKTSTVRAIAALLGQLG